MLDKRAGLPRTLIETPRDIRTCGQHCAGPPRAESLTCRSPSHLLLWFESNGSHRHRRVTLSDLTLAQARRSLRATLRARRRALSAAERHHCAELVAHNVDRHLRLRALRERVEGALEKGQQLEL